MLPGGKGRRCEQAPSFNCAQSSFTTRISKISEAVDVYSDWIDACEAENPQDRDRD